MWSDIKSKQVPDNIQLFLFHKYTTQPSESNKIILVSYGYKNSSHTPDQASREKFIKIVGHWADQYRDPKKSYNLLKKFAEKNYLQIAGSLGICPPTLSPIGWPAPDKLVARGVVLFYQNYIIQNKNHSFMCRFSKLKSSFPIYVPD